MFCDATPSGRTRLWSAAAAAAAALRRPRARPRVPGVRCRRSRTSSPAAAPTAPAPRQRDHHHNGCEPAGSRAHKHAKSSVASLGGAGGAKGTHRRTPSLGASTALRLGGMRMRMGTNMNTDVTLIKPKPLRASGRRLERKSDAWERGVRAGSLRAAKEPDRHLITGLTLR